jgi:hypothetical protein
MNTRQEQSAQDARWQPAAEPERPQYLPEGILRMLNELREAIAGGKVDLVCSTYLALREVTGVGRAEELLRQTDGPDQPPAHEAVIASFSFRPCYMCSDGVLACTTCNGSGMVDRFSCPQCNGLGVDSCQFCLGTGWTDSDDVPEELRHDIVRRRMRHIVKSAAKLGKLTERDLRGAKRLTEAQKRELAAWLLRIQARLAKLPDEDLTDSHPEAMDLNGSASHSRRALAQRIERLLKELTPGKPGQTSLAE